MIFKSEQTPFMQMQEDHVIKGSLDTILMSAMHVLWLLQKACRYLESQWLKCLNLLQIKAKCIGQLSTVLVLSMAL